MKTLRRKEKVYPQIDKAFRCIDTYNRKTSIALWVHPLRFEKSERILNKGIEGNLEI